MGGAPSARTFAARLTDARAMLVATHGATQLQRMLIAPAQAAAEYVGVALQGAFRAVGNGLRSVGDTLQDNPVIVFAIVAAGLILLRLTRRRRR